MVSVLLLAIGVTILLGLHAVAAPASYLPIVNARTLATAIVAGLLCGLARMLSKRATAAEPFTVPRVTLWVVANGLAVAALTSDIFGYWHARELQMSASLDGSLAREMMLTLTWSFYATGAIVVGLRRNYAPIRYFAIALFGVTIAKVVLVDLSYLSQIYRVLSILGLGVLLLITSYLYQRRSRN